MWLLVLLADFQDSIKDNLVDFLRYVVDCLRYVANEAGIPPEARKEDEIQRKGEAKRKYPRRQKRLNVTPWVPSNSLLRSLAYQGPHRDSQANLFALAVLAHQYVHSEFIVADELTKRKLEPAFDPESGYGPESEPYADSMW